MSRGRSRAATSIPLSTFVYRGHGVGLLPSTYCDRSDRSPAGWFGCCRNGRLPPIPVFAVYPSRKFLPLRLSVFLEALTGWRSPLWTSD